MSAETIAILGVGVTLLIAFLTATGWILHRIDAGFAAHESAFDEKLTAQGRAFDEKLTAQGRAFDEKLTAQGRAFDGKLDTRLHSLSEKIDAQGATLTEKIDAQGIRLDNIERAIVDLKVAVARIEGPPRHLLPAR